jgi:hypothetical protein
VVSFDREKINFFQRIIVLLRRHALLMIQGKYDKPLQPHNKSIEINPNYADS